MKNSWISGLWSDNPALVKLLGLCPLLAVSHNFINALSLGLATLFTLVIANSTVSLLRRFLVASIRIPIYVLVIATTVTIIELFIQAWLPGLFSSLGIFLPLIVTNCLIIGRAEAFASRRSIAPAITDALAMGLGFLWVLIILGSCREIIGQGTLFAQAEILFGDTAEHWKIVIFPPENGLLIAILPPGAFILLGLILAGKNALSDSFNSVPDIPSTHSTQGERAAGL